MRFPSAAPTSVWPLLCRSPGQKKQEASHRKMAKTHHPLLLAPYQKGLQPGVQLKKYGRQAVHTLALGLKRRHKIQLSRVREDANPLIECDLCQWLLDGRKASLPSNGVVNMFEPIDRGFPLRLAFAILRYPGRQQS